MKKRIKIKNILLFFLKNVLVTAVIGGSLWFCMNENKGYVWIYHTFLKGNMKMLHDYPELTQEQKFEVKLGVSYTYLNFLKSRTPEDAVILYPTKEDFFPPDTESPFKGEIYNLTWATRFLYPRKLVFPDQMRNNIFAKDITHIAIVNGKGFERIHEYKGEIFEHGVLPVSRQK